MRRTTARLARRCMPVLRCIYAPLFFPHCCRPFEINASDDRTAGTLVRRVQDAVQMQSVLGAKRPNCVIIDEIDGATGGAEGHSAITALIKLVQQGGGRSAGKTGKLILLFSPLQTSVQTSVYGAMLGLQRDHGAGAARRRPVSGQDG